MSDLNVRLLLSSLSLESSSGASSSPPSLPTCVEALTTLSLILGSHREAHRSFVDQGGVNLVLQLLQRTTDPSVSEGCLYVLSSAAKAASCPEAKAALRSQAVFARVHRVMAAMVSDVRVAGGGCKEPVQARLAANLLMDLVSGSTQGQGMARQAGCLHDLMQLFRDLSSQMLQKNMDAWVTVCQAINSCVTTPHNLQNQHEAAAILPESIRLLECWIQKAELHHYRLINLTTLLLNIVAENPSNQERFAKVGGVETAARCILSKAPVALDRNIVLLLGVVLQGNPAAIRLVHPFNMIPFLLTRLPEVDDQSKSVYLLTMAHMVGSSEEQQKLFVRSSGESLVRWVTDQKDAKSHVRHAAECLLTMGAQSNKSSLEPLVNPVSFLPHHPSLPPLCPPTSRLPPPLVELDPSDPFPSSTALFLHPLSTGGCGGGKGNSAGDSGIESGCAGLMPPPPPPPLPAPTQLAPPPPPLLAPPLLPLNQIQSMSGGRGSSKASALSAGGVSLAAATASPSSGTSYRTAIPGSPEVAASQRAIQTDTTLLPGTVTAVLQSRNQDRNNRMELDRAKAVAVFQTNNFVSVVYQRHEEGLVGGSGVGGGVGAAANTSRAVADSNSSTDEPALLDEAHGKSRFLQDWLEQLRSPDSKEAEKMFQDDDRFLQRLREERDREEGGVGSGSGAGDEFGVGLVGGDDAPTYAGSTRASTVFGRGGQDNLDSMSVRESCSDLLSSTTTKTGLRRKRRVEYTEEETHNIVEGVKRFGTNFKDIRKFYKFHPSRTAVSLYDKWRHSLKPREESGARVTARSYILA